MRMIRAMRRLRYKAEYRAKELLFKLEGLL